MSPGLIALAKRYKYRADDVTDYHEWCRMYGFKKRHGYGLFFRGMCAWQSRINRSLATGVDRNRR